MYAIVMGDGVGDGWKNVDEKHINLANRIKFFTFSCMFYIFLFMVSSLHVHMTYIIIICTFILHDMNVL